MQFAKREKEREYAGKDVRSQRVREEEDRREKAATSAG